MSTKQDAMDARLVTRCRVQTAKATTWNGLNYLCTVYGDHAKRYIYSASAIDQCTDIIEARIDALKLGRFQLSSFPHSKSEASA